MAFGLSAGAASLLSAGVGAAGSYLSSKNAAKNATGTTQQNLHPQMDALMYGSPGQQGVISKAVGLLDRPQSPAMQAYGNAAGDYLTQYGAGDMGAIRNGAYNMMAGQQAPQAQAAQWSGTPQMSAAQTSGATPQMTAAQAGPAATMAAPQVGPAAMMTAAQSQGAPQVAAHGQGDVLWNKGETFSAPQAMQAAQVQQPNSMEAARAAGVQMNAPAQNGMDLTGSYDRFINGTPGANPYLDQSIGGAIAQNRLGLQQTQDDLTENLMKNVMPSIRSESVLAGQYGGSRQGIAEGNAIGTLGKEMARAGSQFAQNATNAAVNAKANAYESDSNRALAATQGLGAQQYGAASTNAALAQSNNQFNAGQQQQANATTYGGQLSGALANQGAQMQANSTNYAGQLATNQGNANLAQQANLANQQVGNNAAQFGASAANAASLANAQLGLNNNQFNAGLQQNAGQFNAGQANNMAQYNAGLAQSAGQFNAGQLNNMAQYNAGLTQGANQYNTGLSLNNNQFNAGQNQAANQFNAGQQQQTGLANLGNQQQTNLANLQSQLGTNQLNSANLAAGMGQLGGLLGTAYQTAGNQDTYDINKMSQIGGLLSSFTNAGGSTTSSQPIYQNGFANLLGGASAGLSLYNKFMSGGSSGNAASGPAGTYWDGYGWMPTGR